MYVFFFEYPENADNGTHRLHSQMGGRCSPKPNDDDNEKNRCKNKWVWCWLTSVLSHAYPKELELLTLQTEYKLNWTLEHIMSTDGTINWLKKLYKYISDINPKKNILHRIRKHLKHPFYITDRVIWVCVRGCVKDSSVSEIKRDKTWVNSILLSLLFLIKFVVSFFCLVFFSSSFYLSILRLCVDPIFPVTGWNRRSYRWHTL